MEEPPPPPGDEKNIAFLLDINLVSLPMSFLPFRLAWMASLVQFASSSSSSTKQWYLRQAVVEGVELPVSWATLVVGFYLCYALYRWMTSPSAGSKQKISTCKASHILLRDHGEDSRRQLTAMRAKIGDNPEVFCQNAKKYSACPSSYNKGQLGKFTPGEMDPFFDQLCFDPRTPLHTAVGPVHSRFGYHLLWIDERRLANE
jgi:parvulin-like peptidyl-prolyl isomerase